MAPPVRVVAQYFPQLHAIPENDEWWGEGFTDWDNVKRGTPQYPGHYQPRVPRGGNYYDQSRADVVRWQAELARSHAQGGLLGETPWARSSRTDWARREP